jgi:hypothetical protein
MPQHYLPATFLASFSLDLETPRRRNRRLYVGDKREDRVFRTRAENVAAINDFYTLVTAELESDVGPGMVDSVWTQCERDLSEAITLLINGGVDARTWIRVWCRSLPACSSGDPILIHGSREGWTTLASMLRADCYPGTTRTLDAF